MSRRWSVEAATARFHAAIYEGDHPESERLRLMLRTLRATHEAADQ